MKRFLAVITLGFLLVSCEKVVDVDLNEAHPRLVIEANINISKENNKLYRSGVKLTTTTSFFNDDVPMVEDAEVKITDSNENTFIFSHTKNGLYQSNFRPKKGIVYTLHIKYNDENYTASTSLMTTPTLEYVEQKDDGGFTGDQIELKAFFDDPVDEENYYYFIATSEEGTARNVMDDEFSNGNTIFGLYMKEDLTLGDEIEFQLYGVTEEFHDYMYIVLNQTGPGAGPFETQPATAKGNIVNQSNKKNYPFGYFRISQVSTLDYTIE